MLEERYTQVSSYLRDMSQLGNNRNEAVYEAYRVIDKRLCDIKPGRKKRKLATVDEAGYHGSYTSIEGRDKRPRRSNTK